ncbi:hypothetical protein NF27_EY01790 [Candidatus Jidaibacter acanthamoeba]|uniref:Uncharacterized protein n=1 Tax=Candidatus Jidaibacter acanthamoebae TaxID=86105 RepID=A0A0C1QLY3_9RICK|nr:hypothetical protein [Candidatus Jidaibacter acanthamoeba]KIE05083.1 hypothetical protein NF27_EY01790 [Candidatus Jidaibacter acanthamoeba]
MLSVNIKPISNIEYLTQYPAQIFKNFSENVKNELAEEAIRQKDYQGLEYILKNSNDFNLFIYSAIEALDVKAIEIICNFDAAKKDIHDWHLEKVLSFGIEHEESFKFSYEKIKQDKSDILKLLIKAKPALNIQDLQILSYIVNKEEFEEICKLKEIDASNFKGYETLDLAHYHFDGKAPLLKLSGNEYCADTIDLILSRTYSEEVSQTKLKEIYNNLFNLDPISKEMLSYLAMQIAKGDSIKFIFENGATPFYSSAQNIIKIDTKFLDNPIFPIDSVIIHEIGHYYYDHLFKNDALPFDRAQLENIYQYKEKVFQEKSKDVFYILENITEYIPLFEFYKRIKDYENQAKKPIYKAAEILKVDTQFMEDYVLSENYSEYFKQNSIIDLFLINSLFNYNFEHNAPLDEVLPDSLVKSLLDIYFEYSAPKGQCIYSNNFFREEITTKEMEKWAMETFLPHMINELGLSSTQIHFLERIADYINREPVQYSEFSQDNDFEKHTELIVRYTELKAAGIEQDLIDSFSGLVEFHNKYVTPKAEAELSEYHIYCENFSNNTFFMPNGYEELIA